MWEMVRRDLMRPFWIKHFNTRRGRKSEKKKLICFSIIWLSRRCLVRIFVTQSVSVGFRKHSTFSWCYWRSIHTETEISSTKCYPHSIPYCLLIFHRISCRVNHCFFLVNHYSVCKSQRSIRKSQDMYSLFYGRVSVRMCMYDVCKCVLNALIHRPRYILCLSTFLSHLNLWFVVVYALGLCWSSPMYVCMIDETNELSFKDIGIDFTGNNTKEEKPNRNVFALKIDCI